MNGLKKYGCISGWKYRGKKTKKGICGIDRMMTLFEIAQPSILSHLNSARNIQNTRDQKTIDQLGEEFQCMLYDKAT